MNTDILHLTRSEAIEPTAAVPLFPAAGPAEAEAAPHVRAAPAGGAGVVLGMLAVAVLPAFLTLRTVAEPHRLVPTSVDPTPFGYTWSLSLWAAPVLAIAAWLHRHPGCRLPRRPFWITVLSLTSLGVLLDIAFGNAFFTFPNAGAVLGWYVWGYDPTVGAWMKNIPVEEFGFYFFGIAAAVLIYFWSDAYWFGRARPEDPRGRPGRAPARVRLHWPNALIGVGLVLAAVLYKRFTGQEGFPGYFAFLVAVAFNPACLLLPSVRPFVNWRAYSFTALAMFNISMLWEATVAVPYGWWGYKPKTMIGLFIGAWSNVPIEEPFLWLLVTFTTVIVFEAVKLRLGSSARPSLTPGSAASSRTADRASRPGSSRASRRGS